MDTLAHSVKSYLSAVGAAAIYVSVADGFPKSVGVARDLDRALDNLRRFLELPVTFGWIAWSQSYDALVAIAKTPDLMLRVRADGVKVPKSLTEIVCEIGERADSSEIVLTSHQKAVERANVLARYVDKIFIDLRTSGQMAAFNSAYKNHRRLMQAKGRTVLPYWKVEERLRRVTIRALATSPSLLVAYDKLGELFVQEFPWFTTEALDSYRERA